MVNIVGLSEPWRPHSRVLDSSMAGDPTAMYWMVLWPETSCIGWFYGLRPHSHVLNGSMAWDLIAMYCMVLWLETPSPWGGPERMGPRPPPWVPLLKSYGSSILAFHQFRFKNSEQHLLLGSGGNQNLRPSCRRPPTRTFHPPVGTLRLDAPALVRVHSPNDGNKLGWC